MYRFAWPVVACEETGDGVPFVAQTINSTFPSLKAVSLALYDGSSNGFDPGFRGTKKENVGALTAN